MNGDSRYKLFRNYMVNELGITRADIEQWTKEACAVQAEKVMANIDLEGVITKVARARADYILTGTRGNRDGLRDLIAAEIAKRIVISIHEKAPDHEQ